MDHIYTYIDNFLNYNLHSVTGDVPAMGDPVAGRSDVCLAKGGGWKAKLLAVCKIVKLPFIVSY